MKTAAQRTHIFTEKAKPPIGKISAVRKNSESPDAHRWDDPK